MAQEVKQESIREDVVRAKDHYGRQFKVFTSNFHVIKAGVRYFAVDLGMSFTSTKISQDFPITASVAGSCLSLLEELGVLEQRTESSSQSRYMPGQVNMQRLMEIEEILVESREIESFSGD